MLKVGLQICLICLSTFASAQHGALDSKLHQAVPNYEITADNFIAALVQVSDQFQIPVGIQWINDANARMPIRLSLQNSTVEGIFKRLAASEPNYQVMVKNDVVHVFSKSVPADQNFLLLKVGLFELRDEVVGIGERKLRNTVRALTAPSSSKPIGIGGSLATSTNERAVSLKLDNAMVEDVLDSLVTASGKGIWIVTCLPDSALTPAGYRRTLSLWSSAPVPDEEQPVWNIFRWDEPLPLAGLQVR